MPTKTAAKTSFLKRKPLSESKKAQIVKAYHGRKKVSMRALAERFDVPLSVVARVLKQAEATRANA